MKVEEIKKALVFLKEQIETTVVDDFLEKNHGDLEKHFGVILRYISDLPPQDRDTLLACIDDIEKMLDQKKEEIEVKIAELKVKIKSSNAIQTGIRAYSKQRGGHII